MKLYSYFQSSSAYRVRIALELKQLKPEMAYVNLTQAEHTQPEYARLNPQQAVPTLLTDDGTVLTQSLAIIEYLDDTHPSPPLLPEDAAGRAQVRALAHCVASDIAPLNNLKVRKYLQSPLRLDKQAQKTWYHHWIQVGFSALEPMLAQCSGTFCYGNSPTLADCCLIPQVFNAERFACDLSPYPAITRIAAHAHTLEAFKRAHPFAQADAPPAHKHG